MSIQDQRKALAETKAANDRLIAEIKTKLERTIQLERRSKKINPAREEALLGAFSNRVDLVRSFVTVGGEGYFGARLENEKAFNSFATTYLTFVDQLAGAVEGPRPDTAKRDVAIEVLETRYNGWHETKDHNWMKGILEMNETKLKSSLLEMVERTTADLDRFCSKAATLTSENTEVAISLAPRIKEALESIKNQFSAEYIADTEQNFQLVSNVRQIIADIRDKLISFSAQTIIGDKLEDLEVAVKALNDKRETTGKALNAKTVMEPFAPADESSVAAEKTDELGSAVFVLTKLNVNQEFFETVEKRVTEGIMKSASYSAESDPIYMGLTEKANLYANQIRQIKASPKPNPVALKSAIDNFQYVKKQMETYRATKEKEAHTKLEKAMRSIQQMQVSQKFSEVAELFTASSNVPYTLRAKLMVDNGLTDLGVVYQEYMTAAFAGDKEKMIGIETILKVIKEELNPERVIDDVATELMETERELGFGILDEDTDTLAVEMPEFDMSELDGFGEELEVEAPVSGETTTVNVEPEKKEEIPQNRISSMMLDF